MAETSSIFNTCINSRRGGMLFVGDAATSRVNFIAVLYLVLTVLGGHLTTVSAGLTQRSSLVQPKPHESVRCGPYAVCDVASHFCDTVMNTCIRCSDDCHPGRINGDPLAEEDCKQKCKVYYELKEERDRSIAKATTVQPKINHYRSEDRSDEKHIQLSVRSINLISSEDNLTLARVELLMVVETISVAVITFLLFIICICLLLLLLQRQRATTVYSYSPLDTGRKTASG